MTSLKQRSVSVLASALTLVLFGAVFIYAASSAKAADLYGDSFYFLKKQLIVAFVGVISVLVAYKLPRRTLERVALPLGIATILLLLLNLIPGVYKEVNGAARWIRLGPVGFQPAELGKLSFIFLMAKHLSRKNCNLNSVTSWLPIIAFFGIYAALFMIQPDFGNTALLGAVGFLMLFYAGMRKWQIFSGIFAGSAGLSIAVYAEPYRMSRLVSFMDPWSNVRDGGFQIIQSFLGFQNGGLWGVGLGESRQKLFFLPEAHTDFILTVVAEETGLIGTLAILSLFWVLLRNAYLIAISQKTSFRKILGLGLWSLIFVQLIINTGVVMGLLPTKGITLPFVSSGPSSLLVFMVAIAIFVKLDLEQEYTCGAKHPKNET